MSQEILKAKNLKTAIASLPDPKKYNSPFIRVAVGRLSVVFEKIENEWYLKPE